MDSTSNITDTARNADFSTEMSHLWNESLTVVTACNVAAWIAIMRRGSKSTNAHARDT